MTSEYTIGVLTVSDRCSVGTQEDKSGDALENLLQEKFKVEHVHRQIVPDEIEDIQQVLKDWCDKSFSLIISTGGTGFAPRDVTPEATKPLLDKECPGIVIAMVSESLKITPMAALSRPAAGIRGKTLIVNLPGSVKGCVENLNAIIPIIPHAISLITQDSNKDQHK